MRINSIRDKAKFWVTSGTSESTSDSDAGILALASTLGLSFGWWGISALRVGDVVGAFVSGETVGTLVGVGVGAVLMALAILAVGIIEGDTVGAIVVGLRDGVFVGLGEGFDVVGTKVGLADAIVGLGEGIFVGYCVG